MIQSTLLLTDIFCGEERGIHAFSKSINVMWNAIHPFLVCTRVTSSISFNDNYYAKRAYVLILFRILLGII